MSKLKVDEIRSADRSVSSTANITLADDGNVGIGATSPQDALHIVNSTTRQLRLEGNAPSQYFKETDGSADQNFQLRLDGGQFLVQTNNDAFTSASTKLTISQNGNVGIGSTSTSALLHLKHGSPNIYMEDSDTSRYGNISYGTRAWTFDNTMASGEDMDNVGPWFYFRFTDANETRQILKLNYNGAIGAPTGSNIYNPSDQRLKQNITSLSNCLQKVQLMRGVSFNWIDGYEESEADKTMYGLIAQELQSVDSNLVDNFVENPLTINSVTIENPLRVNEKFIIPILVEAVKELSSKVTALENA